MFSQPVSRSEWEGAQTTLFTILTPDIIPGAFYADCAPVMVCPMADDRHYGAVLWRMSKKAVAPAFQMSTQGDPQSGDERLATPNSTFLALF